MSHLTRREFLQVGAAGGALLLAGRERVRTEETKGKLPQRELGGTGVKVPMLGLGTVAVGALSDEKEALAFIHKAIDLGVTYIDTAPARSGYGRAHTYLNGILKERRKEVFIVTKCLEPNGERVPEFLQKNLKDLGIEQADLVYSHSIGHAVYDVDKLTADEGTMAVLEKSKKDGLTRFIGVTGHNRPEKFVKALDKRDIDVMMNAVNLVDRHTYDFEGVVWPVARKKKVGLVAMKVYGGGVVKCKMPEELRQASLRYALSQPGVALAVIGMRSKDELEQNIDWIKNFKPMPEEEAKELRAKTVELAKQWGAHLDRLDTGGEKSRPLINT